MMMIRRVVVSILFSHYSTVSLQRSVHSQPANSKRDKRGCVHSSAYGRRRFNAKRARAV